jgi:hypothetical protein
MRRFLCRCATYAPNFDSLDRQLLVARSVNKKCVQKVGQEALGALGVDCADGALGALGAEFLPG